MKSLITPQEETRVKQIIQDFHNGKDDLDVLWLCELVQRLARLKPTEEAFPEIVALIIWKNGGAIPLRFEGVIQFEESIEYVGDITPRIEAVTITYTVQGRVCDAELLVRPYIRLIEPQTQSMLDRLRSGRLSVSIDQASVLKESPLDEHLVGFDGYGLRRNPFKFVPPRQDLDTLYGVGELTEKEDTPGVFDPGMLAYPSNRGIFILNDQKVSISISGITLQPKEMLKIVVGLVLGKYTTKSSNLPPWVHLKPVKELINQDQR